MIEEKTKKPLWLKILIGLEIALVLLVAVVFILAQFGPKGNNSQIASNSKIKNCQSNPANAQN